ncbi:MAG: hypothetical protein ACYC8T_25445 [Myxococcaceae bacterium]
MLWTVVLLAATATAPAEDPETRRAREEIEAQLAQMDQAPAPQLEIRFEGITPEHYQVVEASFALDDQPLKSSEGLLETGEVTAGEHVLTGSVLLKDNAPSALLSYGADYRFRVPLRVTLMTQRGLRLEVHLRVRGDDSVMDVDLGKRLKAEVRVDAAMLGPAGDEADEPDDDEAAGGGKSPALLDGGKPFTKMKTGNWKTKKKKMAKVKKARPYTKMKTGEWVSADAPQQPAPQKPPPKKPSPKKTVSKKSPGKKAAAPKKPATKKKAPPSKTTAPAAEASTPVPP